ncbi:MAG: ORF6N domain-containing protein [Ectothiorhodospiraceae bacterium]|nr:ORF6N domain-containing protein [Ectothiorhodospiraceae bacterium]
MEFIQFQGKNTLSLRQLDRLNGVVKGTTFRRFRALEAALVEGRDYFLLEAQEHADFLDDLRQRGLIYPSTVNCLLFTEAGYRKLLVGSDRP